MKAPAGAAKPADIRRKRTRSGETVEVGVEIAAVGNEPKINTKSEIPEAIAEIETERKGGALVKAGQRPKIAIEQKPRPRSLKPVLKKASRTCLKCH